MIMVMTIIIVKWIEVVTSPCLQTRSVWSIFFLVWGLEISIVDWFNPLSPNSDQQQFSPNNLHTLSRDKVVRI